MNNPKIRNRGTQYSGYINLYHEIQSRLSKHNSVYTSIAILFGPNYFLINVAIVLALTYLTTKDAVGAIGFGLYLLFLVIFVVLLFATFISLAITGSQKPEKHVKKIITWLIFIVKTPFKDRLGLNAQELTILRSIAESEQDAADWRGTYVNVMVIGAIGFLWGAGTAAAGWFSENLPIGFQVQSVFSITPTLGVVLIALGWSFACIIANVFGAKLLNYLHDFLISEFSNRAIIYACLEAEAILLSQKIEQEDTLSLAHKKSIASAIGYSVASKRDKEWNYLSPSTEFFFHRGGEHALIDEAEKDKIAKKISRTQTYSSETTNRLNARPTEKSSTN